MDPGTARETRPGISAENHASGSQYLCPGDGDQNVVSSNGVQFNDRSDRRQYNTIALHWQDHAQGIPSAWNLAEAIEASRHKPSNPINGAVIDWLMRQDNYSPLDVNRHHLDVISQATPKTGELILASKALQQWKTSSSSSHRWIGMHGILGSGKTVLASLLIETLKSEVKGCSDSVCIYFYFHEGDDRSPAVGRIWSTLLLQLLQHSPNQDISEEFRAKFSTSVRVSASIHPTEYFGLFQAQASIFKTIYLVIDGLDSCTNSQDERTRQLLHETLCKLPENVRILSTFRHESQIHGLGIRQKIEIKPCEQDVRRYVEYEINKDTDLLLVLENPENKENVVSRVTTLTLESGMFLLANLHLNNIRNRGTLTEIMTALQNLPTTSYSSFEISVLKILHCDNTFLIRLAKHVFTWVVYAKCGLTENQVRDSFAIQTRNEKQYHDSRPAKNAILSACAGLVVEDQKTKRLRLVHESVKDHLHKHQLFLKHPDLTIAKSCLKSLLMKELTQSSSSLLVYSATHWCSHLCKPVSEDVKKLVMNFLSDGASLERAFQMVPDLPKGTYRGVTGLHTAVWFNQLTWIKRLLKSGADIDSQSWNGQTALHWATVYRRYEIMNYLIQHSANPNIADKSGDTALHKLFVGPTTGGFRAVRSLVRGGARFDIKGHKGLTPLSSAIRYGPTSIALFLIKRQTNVDVEVTRGWTSLKEVFFHAHEMIHELTDNRGNQGSDYGLGVLRHAVKVHVSCLIDLLLDRGVELNIPTSDGWLPVLHLVKNGNPNLLQQLLERYPNPADANQRAPNDGRSPLHWALYYNRYPEIELLLKYRADVNEKGPDGTTPLIQAVCDKNKHLVWLFINKGAEVNHKDHRGWSPLHYAIQVESKDVVWLLISNKANVKLRHRNVASFIRMALQKCEYAIAWLLCQHGADVNEVDDQNMTLLHQACNEGRLNEVEFLLNNGVNPRAKDSNGFTALHYAVLSDHQQILDVLLTQRAIKDIIDDPDDKGNNALLLATIRGNEDMVDALTRGGSSCEYTDLDGLTALHHAASLGFNDCLKLLVAGSIDIDQCDLRGYTAVHHAINGSEANRYTIRLLAEAGANLEVYDDQGMTPLMWAVHLGKVSHTRELLLQGANRHARIDATGWSAVDLIHSQEYQSSEHNVIWELLLDGTSSVNTNYPLDTSYFT
ncbi:hypothetical protein SNK04_004529 [Fusarium graminearum]